MRLWNSGNVVSIATENEDVDGESVVSSNIPSPSAVSAMLSQAEDVCYKCNIPIAASPLRHAKRQSELERSVRRREKTNQLVLTEMLRMRK